MKNKPKKTIGELLNELPEGVREKALANTPDDRRLKFPMDGNKLKDALLGAFIWLDSEEGFDYWHEIFESL